MAHKIKNWADWQSVPETGMVSFPGLHERTLRIDINTVTDTRVDLVLQVDRKGVPIKTVFVGVFKGLHTIEIGSVPQDAAMIFSSDDEVWFFTTDGDNPARVSELPSFTRPALRAARDPMAEALEARIYANVERRIAAVQRDRALIERELERVRALAEANGESVDENGVVVDIGTASEPATTNGTAAPLSGGEQSAAEVGAEPKATGAA